MHDNRTIRERYATYIIKPIKLYTPLLCTTKIWLSFMNVVKSYSRWKIAKVFFLHLVYMYFTITNMYTFQNLLVVSFIPYNTCMTVYGSTKPFFSGKLFFFYPECLNLLGKYSIWKRNRHQNSKATIRKMNATRQYWWLNRLAWHSNNYLQTSFQVL